MTLKEIYAAEKQKPRPLAPATLFVKKLMELTGKTEVTVRSWIYGLQQPDMLCKKVISEHLGVSADELFPKPIEQ